MKRSVDTGSIKPFARLQLQGHLFDTGLVNQALNLIEVRKGCFDIKEMYVRPNQGIVRNHSTVVIDVDAPSQEILEDIIERIRNLTVAMEHAEAVLKLKELPASPSTPTDHVTVTDPTSSKKVLLLGSGRVSAPLVEYLGKHLPHTITVVSNNEEEARGVLKRADPSRPHSVVNMEVSATSPELQQLVGSHDMVISLLPATMHAPIAHLAVEKGVHMVTASYVSPGMKALDGVAKSKGVILLNEVGLDPGMDHMSAMKMIHHLKASGEEIVGFSSVCGGLPAPEAANNPLLYKFSWSPKGVMSAAQNDAMYRENGKLIQVPGSDLLISAAPTQSFPTLSLEVLPNRNSLIYGDLYEIPSADTIFRGTLRYRGWSSVMYSFRRLGLLSQELVSSLPHQSWGELSRHLLRQNTWGNAASGLQSTGHFNADQASAAARAMDWLGLFDESGQDQAATAILRRAVEKKMPVVDAFCSLLEHKLTFQSHERDLVLMHHNFLTRSTVKGTPRYSLHQSSLIDFGTAVDTSMAKTVGLATAVSAGLLLQTGFLAKHPTLRGVTVPIMPEIYEPSLVALESMGLKFQESSRVLGDKPIASLK